LPIAATVLHKPGKRCINGRTLLDDVQCQYIYLRRIYSWEEEKFLTDDRRPCSPNRIFAPGEFQVLFQKALETVDLIFTDGIDWKAFFHAFQELRSQYDGDDISIQSIEQKRSGGIVIGLEVSEDVDKGRVEALARDLYEQELQLLEAQYREKLSAKDKDIEIYKAQNTNLWEVVKLQASKPIQVTAIAESQSMGDRNIQMGNGNYIERVDGNYIQGNYINMSQDLAQAAQQIQNLLQQLQNQGTTAETSQQQVATEMAKQAGTNPAMMEKLVVWSKAMANKASETTVSEAVKIVLNLALNATGISVL
jgi:hypothetical protein